MYLEKVEILLYFIMLNNTPTTLCVYTVYLFRKYLFVDRKLFVFFFTRGRQTLMNHDCLKKDLRLPFLGYYIIIILSRDPLFLALS